MKTHGEAGRKAHTAEYEAWRRIFRRFMPSYHSPDAYAGRGIRIARAFKGRHGFERFLAEVGRRPTKLHSLDRIDNDRGYAPGNLRWATKKQQANNRRRRRWFRRPR